MQNHIPKDANLENTLVRTSSLSVSSSLSKTAGVRTALQSSLLYCTLLQSDILYKVRDLKICKYLFSYGIMMDIEQIC
jgi:hypothetical protein